VNEKLKTQRRSNQLESLAHELEMRALNQDIPSPVDQEAPENRSKSPCAYLVDTPTCDVKNRFLEPLGMANNAHTWWYNRSPLKTPSAKIGYEFRK